MAKHRAKCPKCGGRLDYESAVDEKIVCPACQVLLSVPGKVRPSDKVDPLLGQSLGEFEIVELLGRGGMGAVYKARQPALDRFVAVKVLPQAFSRDASFVERFSREARAAAAVTHPNIIQVLTVGQDKGFQFMAMELVEGETLAQLLKREGRLSPERGLDLLKQVAAALAEAHTKGIIHRDIKPSNILLTPKGVAKVADFGLAKRAGVDVSVTQTGQTLGTPLYMPPEAARGEPYDARSDLYSLGATFYQALAGRPPFEADTPAAVIVQHIEAEVPPLAQAAPDAPPALCRILHRLLYKKPGDRYQSADGLLEALDRIPSSPSVPPAGSKARGRVTGAAPAPVAQAEPTRTLPGAPHPPLADRLQARKQRQRRVALLAGVGGCAAILLIVVLPLVLSGRREQAKAPPPPAPEPRTPAPEAAVAERNAETILKNAQTCTDRADWPKAHAWLDRLKNDCGQTKFHAAHRAEIEALRSRIEAALKPPPPPKTPEPAPKKEPEPPKPTPEPTPPTEPDAEARWKELQERAGKLTQAGDHDGAARLLESAKDIKLEDIEERIAEAVEAVAAAKRAALDRALAAYAEQSEKVWALFKERHYEEAEKLIAALKAKPESRPAADHLAADEQAAGLLKELWAAVERTMAGMKGQFVAFGGAGGKILAVQDGQVTVTGAGGAEFTVPVVKLGAKQALHYSGLKLKADARSKLMAAVLLLADATALDEAGEALDKAGDGPSVAIYKERLNAQLTAAAEASAQKAWLRIEEEATGKLDPAKAARLTKSLADFAKAHGETKFHKGLGEKLAALKTRIEDSLVFTEWPFDEKEAKRRQKVTADALGIKIEQDIEIAKGVKMTFVLIPAGEFLMGSPPTTSPVKLAAAYGGDPKEYEAEFPQHRVKISRPFWMAKHEVTQEQYMAILQTNPSNFKDKPKNPVECVSWDLASGFARVLGEKLGKTFRLPTEAEWEYACRGGTSTEFYFGNDAAKAADYAWVGVGSTAPVGQRKPNAWGLCDMAGNVWEWCEDWYGKCEGGAQTDPKGAPTGSAHVLRGGSWYGYPRRMRSAFRPPCPPDTGMMGYGFRVVLVPGPR